jgi:hypothetical protein
MNRSPTPAPFKRLTEECVLAVQDGFLQGTLDNVVVDWRVRLPQKKNRLGPAIQ